MSRVPSVSHRPWTNAFRNALPFNALRPAAELRMWGDGLCGHSLDTALYPATWETICDDELVFLMPSLASRWLQRSNATPSRAAAFVLAQVQSYLNATFQSLPSATVPAAARLIVSSGVLAASLGDVVGMEPTSPVLAAPFAGVAAFKSCDREYLDCRLAVLAELDRLYADALAVARDPSRPAARPLEQVALASIFARINGAFVYPQYAASHEILATCAWLGHLLDARPALMPRVVADVLCDVLRPDAGDCGAADPIVALIRWYGDAAAGQARLYAAARRVSQTGRAEQICCRSGGGQGAGIGWNRDVGNG